MPGSRSTDPNETIASALEAARQRLELERQALHREADQLKDDFVALVSHELRTPLASIIATLEVLEDETEQLSPDGRRFVDMIDRDVDRDQAGSVRVALRGDGDRVRLEVRDSGIGIPAHEHAQLFERFYRGSAAIEHEVPGTGLGLWITDAIVRMHDGTIAVHSEVGAGTTFIVVLPGAQPTRPGAP